MSTNPYKAFVPYLVTPGEPATAIEDHEVTDPTAGDWRRVPLTGAEGRSVGLGVRRRSFPSAAHRVVADTIRTVIAREAAGPSGIYPAATIGR